MRSLVSLIGVKNIGTARGKGVATRVVPLWYNQQFCLSSCSVKFDVAHNGPFSPQPIIVLHLRNTKTETTIKLYTTNVGKDEWMMGKRSVDGKGGGGGG